jgi:hypothetical protein
MLKTFEEEHGWMQIHLKSASPNAIPLSCSIGIARSTEEIID